MSTAQARSRGEIDRATGSRAKTKLYSPSKQPEQSRAYVHLVSEAHIKPFEAKFLSIVFQDAKGTHKDPNLGHLPPTLGFAASQRIPTSKQRVDGRQGTIDQDPEFIAFLEGETQPVAKPASLDSAVADKPVKEKVTTTPLIEALREKKASKAKAAAAKSAKRNEEAKEEKSAGKGATTKGSKAAGAESTTKGSKADQTVKDTVKSPHKQAAKASVSAAGPAVPPAPVASAPAAGRKRERVTPNSIKSMLQRDLGISSAPKRADRAAGSSTATANMPTTPVPNETLTPKEVKSPKGGRQSTTANKENGLPPQETAKSTTTPPTGGTLKKTQAAQPNPKTPRTRTNASTTGQTAASAAPIPVPANAPSKAKSTPQPLPGTTKAYLKHANASQGITEPLMKAALEVFGDVVSVDIDKRKGTALAEFKDHESLKAAMAKRHVSVAQGAIEVLEYRDKATSQTPRGGGAVGRGGSMRGRSRGGLGRGGSAVPAATAGPGANTASPTPTASGEAT